MQQPHTKTMERQRRLITDQDYPRSLLLQFIGVRGVREASYFDGMQSRGKFMGLTTIRGGGAMGDKNVLPPSPEDDTSRDRSDFLLYSLLNNSILQ